MNSVYSFLKNSFSISNFLYFTVKYLIIELSTFIFDFSLSKEYSQKIYDVVIDFNKVAEKSIDAFTKPDRLLAIEAISMHKQYENKLSLLRTSLGNKKQIPLDFLDLIYMFERIAQSWADVADLVQPIYNE